MVQEILVMKYWIKSNGQNIGGNISFGGKAVGETS